MVTFPTRISSKHFTYTARACHHHRNFLIACLYLHTVDQNPTCMVHDNGGRNRLSGILRIRAPYSTCRLTKLSSNTFSDMFNDFFLNLQSDWLDQYLAQNLNDTQNPVCSHHMDYTLRIVPEATK